MNGIFHLEQIVYKRQMTWMYEQNIDRSHTHTNNKHCCHWLFSLSLTLLGIQRTAETRWRKNHLQFSILQIGYVLTVFFVFCCLRVYASHYMTCVICFVRRMSMDKGDATNPLSQKMNHKIKQTFVYAFTSQTRIYCSSFVVVLTARARPICARIYANQCSLYDCVEFISGVKEHKTLIHTHTYIYTCVDRYVLRTPT